MSQSPEQTQWEEKEGGAGGVRTGVRRPKKLKGVKGGCVFGERKKGSDWKRTGGGEEGILCLGTTKREAEQ